MGLVRIGSWREPGEAACLARHAAGKRRPAEIGVWEGGTTRPLRQGMSPDGGLYAVGPFPTGRVRMSYQRPIAHGEVARVANGEVVWIRDTGVRAAQDPRVPAAPLD